MHAVVGAHLPYRLIVFAKYPRLREVKTRLVPPLTFEESTDLYRSFLLDALRSHALPVSSVEIALYVASADDLGAMRLLVAEGLSVTDGEVAVLYRAQRGEGLGERLAAAFKEAFDAGCERACIIGTDHPTLPSDYARRAFAALDESDVCIGPTEDGGYYLIALRAPQPSLFREMPFSTPDLLDATRRAARHAGLRVAELPPWYDVDDEPSLRKLWRCRDLLSDSSATLPVLTAIARRLGFDADAVDPEPQTQRRGG